MIVSQSKKSLRRYGVPLSSVAAVLLCTAPVTAQVITASVRGSVVDASGSSVPNAAVRVVNTSTNIATEVKADENGRFVFPSLEPGGPYTLSVTAPGFKIEARTGITLAVSQVADITVPLQVGASTETVEVHADVSQIETSSGAISGLVENRSIVNLPLNQRNPYALVFLLPGATGTVGTAYNSANISINGGRPGSMDILVDGIPASPPLANPIQGFAVFPSVDAVDEFKVLSNGLRSGISVAAEAASSTLISEVWHKPCARQRVMTSFATLRWTRMIGFNKLNGKALAQLQAETSSAQASPVPVYLPHLYKGTGIGRFFPLLLRKACGQGDR